MDLSNPAETGQTLETYQGEIFQLYIVLNKKLRDVIENLKQKHNFDVSPKMLKTKLNQWGYKKNITRCDVVPILEEKARRQSAGIGEEYTLTLRQHPLDPKKFERYRQRAGLRDTQPQFLVSPAQSPTAYLTPPTSLSENSRISEKLFYDIDILIKGSFEAGLWSFKGNDLIIKSSPSQFLEHQVLHNFLAEFAMGSHAAEAQDFVQAGSCWQRAFLNIEPLVKGRYHDIIPNLIQKINDLNHQRPEIATLLKRHISQCSRDFTVSGDATASIYDGIGKLDMSSMRDIEGKIMEQFAKLFELYLGQRCYSSFVIMMDGARRRLLQCPWVTFDILPNLSRLDSESGPADRRSLDIMGMRVEILSHRRKYPEAEVEASKLIQRSEKIQNDDWRRFYNLTRGFYFLGSARYFLRKRDAAIQSLSNALRYDDELCKIDDFHIFNAERMIMEKYLEHLKSPHWIVEESEGSDIVPTRPVGSLMFFRCCKEPIQAERLELK